MNGCVNKVNNFDKDLLVLVIFGLRGFKTKLDSQTALKYAYICQNEISLLENTVSVSVGVTTGITYCGVLGHPLRKEYTVISLTVNKAARLMMAYPGKVTCDKETFLQSKLDAKNFILQTFKYLKGIGNPGPVYEFVQLQQYILQKIYLIGFHNIFLVNILLIMYFPIIHYYQEIVNFNCIRTI